MFGLPKLYAYLVIGAAIVAMTAGTIFGLIHYGQNVEKGKEANHTIEDITHGVEVRTQAEDAAAKRSACESVERLRAVPRPCN